MNHPGPTKLTSHQQELFKRFAEPTLRYDWWVREQWDSLSPEDRSTIEAEIERRLDLATHLQILQGTRLLT